MCILLFVLFSWLKEKHSTSGTLDILFRNRTDYRIKFIVNSPSFPSSTNGDGTNDTPEKKRLTANEARAKMLAIEKCDKVVMNPLFGSKLPKLKVILLDYELNYLYSM